MISDKQLAEWRALCDEAKAAGLHPGYVEDLQRALPKLLDENADLRFELDGEPHGYVGLREEHQRAKAEVEQLRAVVAQMRAVVEAAQEISAQIEVRGRTYFHTRQKLSDALAALAGKGG